MIPKQRNISTDRRNAGYSGNVSMAPWRLSAVSLFHMLISTLTGLEKENFAESCIALTTWISLSWDSRLISGVRSHCEHSPLTSGWLPKFTSGVRSHCEHNPQVRSLSSASPRGMETIPLGIHPAATCKSSTKATTFGRFWARKSHHREMPSVCDPSGQSPWNLLVFLRYQL